jgi:GNAT superfamily N-acetyltransferase
MFSRSSSETIFLRFHLPYPEVPEWMINLMLDVDHHDRGALVAVAEERIVGHAMYAGQGDGTETEMAIVVEDGWQAKGVGKLLLRELAEEARSQGVETFVGTILPVNRRMPGLIGAVFTESRRVFADGVSTFRAPLRALKPADPVHIYPRVAKEHTSEGALRLDRHWGREDRNASRVGERSKLGAA